MYCDIRGIGDIPPYNTIPIITGKENSLESLRKAGIIHKMIRRDIRPILKPGLNLYDLANYINERTRYYVRKSNIMQCNDGIAFPPVLSRNNVIAHYSPNKIDKVTIQCNDNLKVDFGVHVNGWIVDSAFTFYFNAEYYTLHQATKEALDSAIKLVGIDQPINDVSSVISEIIESYEIIYQNDIHSLKVIDGLGGHNILQYNIHGGMHVPNKPNILNRERFGKGIYAIEPFTSILDSRIIEGTSICNYRLKQNLKELCPIIYEKFNNLIFSDSHLEHYNIHNMDMNMISLYPPLEGIKGDMSCQYEHTIYLGDNIKEVISKSTDY